MINVIIVDDEKWVIRLIRKLVDWEGLGFCIVGECDNGDDALTLIRSKEPQVIITDIRMPGNSGLDLIRQAKQIKPEIMSVIISGYGEFDYAKTALELGVFAYLIKPVDKLELEDVLVRIRGEIRRQRNDQSDIQQERRINLQGQKLDYFKLLLTGQDCEPLDEGALNEKYDAGFSPEEYLVLAYELIFPTGSGKENLQLRKKLMDSIFDSVDAELKTACREVVKMILDRRIIMVANYSKEEENGLREAIEESYRRISIRAIPSTGYRLIIGVSTAVCGLGELPLAYKDAVGAAYGRVYFKDASILSSPAAYDRRPLTEILPMEMEKRLRRTAEICDAQEIEALLTELLQPPQPLHPEDLFRTAEFIINIFFQSWRLHEQLLREYGIGPQSALRDVENCLNIQEIISSLMALVGEVQKRAVDAQQSQQEKIVSQIKAFIHKHYAEKLTLERICEAVYFSPQYVCTVFKVQEGVTIVDYLTDYRISVAKELLLNKQYHATDVMRMVGYQDAKYFGKVFKKKMGVTPSEYRKMFT